MLLRSLGSGGIHRTSRICLVSWLSVASTPCVGRPSARSTSRSLAAILTLMGCFSSWYSSAHHCMILGTCDAAKAAACNRTARSAIVTALLGRFGGLFRRSIDIVDTYYRINQFSNVLDAAHKASALSMGFDVRRWSQCSAAK